MADLLTRRNRAIQTGDELRAESKRLAREVGVAAKAGGDVEALKDAARDLKDRIRRRRRTRTSSAASCTRSC